VDPQGLLVRCTEDVWAVKAQKHGEVGELEEAFRRTIRAPDAVYFDPASTAQKRPTGGAVVENLHYVSGRVTTGRYHGHLLVVVVKWRRQPDGVTEAYVQTMHVANQVKPRMVMRWKRDP
jgi:hypothetical protein